MPTEQKTKIFVVDSSVFLHDPNAIFAFEQNIIVVPGQVIADLDSATKLPGERGANARQALAQLWSIITGGKSDFKSTDERESLDSLLARTGVAPEGINALKSANVSVCNIIPSTKGILALYEPAVGFPDADGGIFATTSSLDAILVTKNTAQRLAACSRQLKAEEYRHDRIMDDDRFYSGRSILYLPGMIISELASKKKIPMPKGIYIYYADNEGGQNNVTERLRGPGYRLSENEFLTIHNADNPTSTYLARYAQGQLHALNYANSRPFEIDPRNAGQCFAIEALMAPCDVAPLVILKGQAGTAKTFLSLACGLQQAYNDSVYNRVIVSRPGNSVIDAQVGYLPGDERSKVEPLNRAIFDNVEALFPNTDKKGKKDGVPYSPATELLDKGVLQLQAMTFMRGRSIQSSFIIIDEAQNATPEQLRALTTRPNVGTKIVLTGDVEQIDDMYLDKFTSGLTFVSERMRGSPLCWQVTFTDDECERSALVADVLRRLGPN